MDRGGESSLPRGVPWARGKAHMRRWSLSHYAISCCVTAALLAGCGGSFKPIGTPGTAQGNIGGGAPQWPAAARPAVHRNELLDARHVKIHGHCRFSPEARVSKFRTRGTASGPYPGTFSANGSYTQHSSGGWSFEEFFTIHVGSSEISGSIGQGGSGEGPFSCKSFGGAVFTYTTQSRSGKVKIVEIDRSGFREILKGL